MDEKSQKLIDHLKKVTMNESDKAFMRSSLLSQIRSVKTEELKKVRAVPSPFLVFLSNYRGVYASFAVFVVLILGSGSVSFAAEGSLPGEILYSIKRGVNENVVRLVKATNPNSAADFETALLDKRLREAETLSATNKLNEPLRAEVKKLVVAQKIEAESKIEKAQALTLAATPNTTTGSNAPTETSKIKEDTAAPETTTFLAINTSSGTSVVNVEAATTSISVTMTTAPSTIAPEKTEAVRTKSGQAPAPQISIQIQSTTSSSTTFERSKRGLAKNKVDTSAKLKLILEKHERIIQTLEINQSGSDKSSESN